MIQAIALDDEPLALEIIEHYCASLPQLINLQKTFLSEIEAEEYLLNYPVDLIFLDIQMPRISGVEFFKNLQNPPLVIFTTAFSSYAVDGFELNAIDYLLKPFPPERFKRSLEKAKRELEQLHSKESKSFLNIRADYKQHRILYDEILFIEGLDDYVQINLINQNKITARYSLKSIEELLQYPPFLRIHRSYIANISKVTAYNPKYVQIGSKDLPIGEKYKQSVSQKLESL